MWARLTLPAGFEASTARKSGRRARQTAPTLRDGAIPIYNDEDFAELSNVMNILTLNLLLSTLVFWSAARLYLLPTLHDYEPRAVLLPILLLHSMRHLGLMFLAPGATNPGMPAQFAYPAALGDVLASLLALIALPAVATQARSAKLLVWLFNIGGTLDLINAIVLATVYDAAPFMGPGYWIPAFWVPALLVTHYITFILLGKPWPAAVTHQSQRARA